MKAWKLHLIDTLVVSVAPPAPPCFEARDIWLQYLRSAIEVQTSSRGSPGPVLRDTHGTATDAPNPEWSFCKDCVFTATELEQKRRLGACQPTWWRAHAEEAQRRRVIPIKPVTRAQLLAAA